MLIHRYYLQWENLVNEHQLISLELIQLRNRMINVEVEHVVRDIHWFPITDNDDENQLRHEERNFTSHVSTVPVDPVHLTRARSRMNNCLARQRNPIKSIFLIEMNEKNEKKIIIFIWFSSFLLPFDTTFIVHTKQRKRKGLFLSIQSISFRLIRTYSSDIVYNSW